MTKNRHPLSLPWSNFGRQLMRLAFMVTVALVDDDCNILTSVSMVLDLPALLYRWATSRAATPHVNSQE
jgi:hypothetical protein